MGSDDTNPKEDHGTKRKTPFQLQTLERLYSEEKYPEQRAMEGYAASPSRFPPVSLRRSHLDSATYRNLVRLLSYCVDYSIPSEGANPGLDSTPIQEPRRSSDGNDHAIDGEIASVEACGDSVVGASGENGGLVESLGREVGDLRDEVDYNLPIDLGSGESRLGDGSVDVGICQQVGNMDAFESGRDDDFKGFELTDELISDCSGLIDFIEGLDCGEAEDSHGVCASSVDGSHDITDSKHRVLGLEGEREEGKIQEGKGCIEETVPQVLATKNSEMIIPQDGMSCLPRMELLLREMSHVVQNEDSRGLGLVAELDQGKTIEEQSLSANKTIPEVATNEDSNLIVTQDGMHHSAKELCNSEMRQDGISESSEDLRLVAELQQGKIHGKFDVCINEALAEVPETENGEMIATRAEVPCPHIELLNKEMRQDGRHVTGVLSSLTELELGKMPKECNLFVNKALPEVAAIENSKLVASPDKMRCPTEELEHKEMRRDQENEVSSSESVIAIVSEKPAEVKEEDTNVNLMKEMTEMVQQERHVNLDPAVDVSGSRILEKNWTNAVVASASSAEMEEGEIPDDVQILDQDLKRVDEDNAAEYSKSRDGLGDVSLCKKELTYVAMANFSKVEIIDDQIRLREIPDKVVRSNMRIQDEDDKLMNASAANLVFRPQKTKNISIAPKITVKCQAVAPYTSLLSRVVSENRTIQAKEQAHCVEDNDVHIKKKRGPLTEERKAKKKKAKKRKRAQKEREQGVKRLRLQPIVKPKPVIYCDFYLKGRCQQGELCRFSHDTTPLTKSQPCKYFACDTCLKGEDCPFDHQLFKYPCHNFMSKGMCIRGDNCKFSHKIGTAEGHSITSEATNSDPQFSSEKSILRKQLNGNNNSRVLCGTSKTACSGTPFSTPKLSEGNLIEKTSKPSVRIPDGIRFVSFEKGSYCSADLDQAKLSQNHNGKGLCNSANKHPNKLPPNHAENKVYNLENRDKTSIDEGKNFFLSGKPVAWASSTSLSHPAGQTSVTKEAGQSGVTSCSAAARSSSSLQAEVTDAFEILEEFLFGGQLRL